MSCQTPAGAGAAFCEECGAALPAAGAGAPDSDAPGDAPAGSSVTAPLRAVADAHAALTLTAQVCADPACAGPLDSDGYCQVCGTLAPKPRDHMREHPASWVASVSDRGRRHHRNEDAAACAADPGAGSWAALVVCDGVSSSQDSDVASLAAARAALSVLVRERGTGLATGDALTALRRERVMAAGAAAAKAVATATPADHGDSPPSCTFVAALIDGAHVCVGSIGDSRAYWVPDTGAVLALTTDDSVAAEQIAAGVPRQIAESGPMAHAITRWLGVDCPEEQVPALTDLQVTEPGWLLVCSDGLWNYCSEGTLLAPVVAQAATMAGGDPAQMARALVAWANEQGGKDNITVALARLGVTNDKGEKA